MMMRMLCDGPLGQTAGLGSPGVDEVRWTKPVRPGDVLSCRHVCIEKRDLASRPDVGLSKLKIELIDANGNVLCWWQTNQLTRKRNPGITAPAPAGASKPPRVALASLWDLPSQPPLPTHTLFFEDRQIGEITDLGSHTFTRDETIAFARQFDPQPFHLDEAAAKASLFGGLSASGWHTSAIFIRQVVTHRLAGEHREPTAGERVPAYGPSPGFRNLRWPKPVFVGDTITYRARLAEKIDLKSRPDRGILASEVQGRNQNGQIVFALTSQILVDRRTPYRPA
jgi:acyl dehydratase